VEGWISNNIQEPMLEQATVYIKNPGGPDQGKKFMKNTEVALKKFWKMYTCHWRRKFRKIQKWHWRRKFRKIKKWHGRRRFWKIQSDT
jgi:hypothetical protein